MNEGDVTLATLRDDTVSLTHVGPSSWNRETGRIFHLDMRESAGEDMGFGFVGWSDSTDTGSNGAYDLDSSTPLVGFADDETHTPHTSFLLTGFDTLKESDSSFTSQLVSTAFPYELTQAFQATAGISGSWVHDHRHSFCMSMIFAQQFGVPLTGEARNFLTGGDLQQLTGTGGSVIFPLGLG